MREGGEDVAGVSGTSNGPVAFVLSGGASHGAIEVGMLRALYERGITPDMIVATSVGAFNGGFIASRPPTVETVDLLADVWLTLRQRDVFPITNLATGFFGFIGRRNHLVSDHGLRALLDRWLEFTDLEQAKVPLHVIATDLASGAELRLSSGPAADAVLASGAIPGVFPPVRWGGRTLVDGGVANNTPITHAIEMGAREVYVLPTGFACALAEAPQVALSVAVHALTLLLRQRLVADIQRVPDDIRLVVMPPPCPLAVLPTDFSHPREMIDRGEQLGRAFLSAIGEQRHAVPPVMLGVHQH